MPTPRSLQDIKLNLLKPALTSHFEVQITKPDGLTNDYLSANGLSQFAGIKQGKLNLLCSETVLPGSSLATHEINNDFTGVTERHAYRRLYDDRIDLSFYVDAENYLPIRFFETWIKYAVNENVGNSTNGNGPVGSKNSNYFYRANYPKLYISENGLSITKFERDYKNTLTYNFVNVFPIAVSSMPVSYDTSSLLKCSVSLTYIRYYITGTTDKQSPAENSTPETTPGGFGDPALQAAYNRANNPLEGNGFADPKLEASAQAALGATGSGTFSDLSLDARAQAALGGNQEDITINSFGR